MHIPFWSGPKRPNQEWFEVRTGADQFPSEVGVTAADCILLGEFPCVPILVPAPENMALPRSGVRYVRDSVWLPDSDGFLYMIHVDTDPANQTAEQSELWMYHLADQSFHRLFELPGAQYFEDPRFYLEETGYRSPDGGSIIISGWNTFSLLNIETGEMVPLTETGILLGTITLP